MTSKSSTWFITLHFSFGSFPWTQLSFVKLMTKYQQLFLYIVNFPLEKMSSSKNIDENAGYVYLYLQSTEEWCVIGLFENNSILWKPYSYVIDVANAVFPVLKIVKFWFLLFKNMWLCGITIFTPYQLI